MTRTGELVRQPGLYSSACCSYENGFGESQEFPVCGTCSRSTDWVMITPGPGAGASTQDPVVTRKPMSR